ncbi:hypothetical protein C8R46DRAFT_1027924 [Mycena filopes]|nr:hypothetical protein C8R46DRAFT_1027924 [Mycena filopes]
MRSAATAVVVGQRGRRRALEGRRIARIAATGHDIRHKRARIIVDAAPKQKERKDNAPNSRVVLIPQRSKQRPRSSAQLGAYCGVVNVQGGWGGVLGLVDGVWIESSSIRTTGLGARRAERDRPCGASDCGISTREEAAHRLRYSGDTRGQIRAHIFVIWWRMNEKDGNRTSVGIEAGIGGHVTHLGLPLHREIHPNMVCALSQKVWLKILTRT